MAPQQQTASNSNSDSISDQQPVRTRLSLSTLLSQTDQTHVSCHPSKSFDADVLQLEICHPYGCVKCSNRIAAAARPRRPAPTCPTRWWDDCGLVSTKCYSILSFLLPSLLFLPPPFLVRFCSALLYLVYFQSPSKTSLEAPLAIPSGRLHQDVQN